MCKFGHLHAHYEYSKLDGMGTVREMFETAKSLGQDFLAITDHGTMAGVYEAQKVGEEVGVKPIIGCEFYYESERDEKHNSHLLVIAKNNAGLQNMFELQELSSQNFWKKPRINFEMLKEHSEGLVVTSACLGSVFNQYIIHGEIMEAKNWARKFKSLFGEDFYIEIQPNGIDEQKVTNKYGIQIANELNIDIVATNDVHYTYETDCFPHEVMLAMQTKKKMEDEKRFSLPDDAFWLKTEEEMYDTFAEHGIEQKDLDRALRNTSVIASKCDAKLVKGKYLPTYYDIPDGKTERDLLVERVRSGIKKKGYANDKPYLADVQHELNVIDDEGYSGYFCIVADYVNSAKEDGVVVGDGRGSGAGSKVANLTGITEIRPEDHNLLFERFMAKGRSPDFDVDFSSQEAVYQDLKRKYGERNVARIVAFGRMSPKAVVRKVLSTFGHKLPIQNKFSKAISGNYDTLEEELEQIPDLHKELKKHYSTELGVMLRLQNVISHYSKHAGGIIIYPDLQKHLPLHSDSDDRSMRVVSFDKYMLEELGHYKFDVLGLETLPIIQNAVESIKESEGVDIDLYNLDLEDPNVYKMLQEGDVSGVFQINNQSQKVMEQKPQNFNDLVAINALIRP